VRGRRSDEMGPGLSPLMPHTAVAPGARRMVAARGEAVIRGGDGTAVWTRTDRATGRARLVPSRGLLQAQSGGRGSRRAADRAGRCPRLAGRLALPSRPPPGGPSRGPLQAPSSRGAQRRGIPGRGDA
jgi:hypothetical protein